MTRRRCIHATTRDSGSFQSIRSECSLLPLAGSLLGLLLGLSIALTACGDGGSNGHGTGGDGLARPSQLAGVVQKGPFLLGSSVTVQELVGGTLEPTGTQFDTITVNDLGDFQTTITVDSGYVEIITDGYYFDEIGNHLSDGRVTLRTISTYSAGRDVNINLLTQLARNRVKYLVQNGMDFNSALSQAQQEVLAAFGITETNVANFDTLDITSDAILLAISAIFQQTAINRAADGVVAAELSYLTSTFGADIEADGALDDPIVANDLRSGGMDLDLASVRGNLEGRYAAVGQTVQVGPFEDYIDSDGDGLLNKDDFVLNFTPVYTELLSTPFTSNSVEIVLSASIEYSTAMLSNGSIVLNGVDTELQQVQISNGDLIAIRLVSRPEYERFETVVSGTLSIDANSGTFQVILQYPQPQLVGYYSTEIQAWDIVLSTEENTAFVVGWGGYQSFQVFDISDPSTPTKTSGLITTYSYDHLAKFHNSNKLLATSFSTSSKIIDVSILSDPTIVKSFGGRANRASIALDDATAYIAELSGFRIYNISDPLSPILIGAFDTAAGCQMGGDPIFEGNCEPVDVQVSADQTMVFVSSGWGGLKILDITNPASPSLVTTYHLGGTSSSVSALRLSADETKLYLVGGRYSEAKGFHVIDISNPAAPTLVGSYIGDQFRSGEFADFVLSTDESKVYGGVFNGGFVLLTLREPTQPEFLGSFYEVIETAPQVTGVALSADGTLAYIAEGLNGLRVLSIGTTTP